MRNRKWGIIFLALIMLFGGTAIGVSAEAGLLPWLTWSEQAELDDAELIVIQLVSDINTLDGEITTLTNATLAIDTQVNLWLDGDIAAPYTEADLNTDGTVTLSEKLFYLEALHSSSAGGHAALLLEVAALQSELADIDLALDNLITGNTDIVLLGTETELEKIALVNTYIDSLKTQIQDLTDEERDYLYDELGKANLAAITFRTDICTEIDNLPNGIYNNGNYSTYCD